MGKLLDKMIANGDASEVDEVSEKKASPVKAKKSLLDTIVASGDGEEAFHEQQTSNAQDMALLAAQGAARDFLDEGVGFVKSKLNGTEYKDERNQFRDKIGAARERMGVVGDAAELVGNVGTSMIPGARIATTVGVELADAALQGLGSADEMEDAPLQVAKSMAASGAAQVGGKVVSKYFEEPAKILARTAGARGMDFLKGRGGKMAPDKVAKELDDLGFFRQGEVVFDTQKKKFLPNPSKGRLETFFKPQSLEDLHNRAQIAMTAIKTKKAELLKGKVIPLQKLATTINDGINEFIPKGFNVASREEAIKSVRDTIFDDLSYQGVINRGGVDATGLDTYKGYLGAETDKSFIKRLKDVGMDDEAIMKFRSKIDDLLTSYGGIDYKDNNLISHKLNLLAEDAWNKISRESGYGVEGPRLTRGNWWDKTMDLVNPAPVGVARARIGNNIDGYPIEAIRKGFKRAPVEMIDNNAHGENYEEQIPMQRPNEQKPQGRNPNSVPNLAEQFIRTPLPRTTEELMKNKQFVLGKVAQMMPEMFESVKDVYDHNPENLGELAQVIAQKMPHMFAKDKYNRFDGRIVSEKDKQAAIKDTLLNDKISTIEQAKIITKLNKEGLFEGQ